MVDPNVSDAGHGDRLQPLGFWLAPGPVNATFLEKLITQQELEDCLRHGSLQKSENGLILQAPQGAVKPTPENLNALDSLVVALSDWFSHDPRDPRFWSSSYQPMADAAFAVAERAAQAAHAKHCHGILPMLIRLGTYFHTAAHFEKAMSAAQLASKLASTEFGKESEEYASAIVILGNATAEHDSKSKGIKLLKESLRIRQKLFGRKSLQAAESLFHVGNLSMQNCQFEQGFDFLEECLETRERLLPENDLEVANALDVFGLCHFYLDRFDGVQHTERAMAIRRAMLAEDHPWVAESLNNLALFYEHTKPDADFEGMYRQCYSISRKWYGLFHSETLTHAENLAIRLKETSQFEEAEELFHYVVAATERMHGDEAEMLPLHLSALAECLAASEKTEEAERAIERGVELLRKVDENGEAKRSVMTTFGNVYFEMGNQQQAIEVYSEVLELLAEAEDPETEIVILSNLSSSLKAVSRYDEAVHRLEQGLEIARREFGRNSRQAADLLRELRTLSYEAGNSEQELLAARELLSVLKKVARKQPEEIAAAHHSLAFTLGRCGLEDEIEDHLSAALNLYEQSLGADHPNVALVLITFGEYQTPRHPDQAIQTIRKALEIQHRAFDEDSPQLFYGYHSLAEAQLAGNLFAQALESVEHCLLLRFGNPGAESLADSNSESDATSLDSVEANPEAANIRHQIEEAHAALANKEFDTVRETLRSILSRILV